MNFRSKQLDSVFTPKAEITGPADNSIIKKNKNKKLKPKERTNTGLNNDNVFGKKKNQQSRNPFCYFDVPLPVNTSRMSRNLAPILR